MNLKEILSISGTAGLFQYIAQGKGGIIVEAINDTKRRTMVNGATKVSSLGDIAIFSENSEVALSEIFDNLYKANKGVVAIDGKSTAEQLEAFLSSVLPDYDRSKVHNSDIRKIATWYNTLVAAGHTSFTESDEQESAPEVGAPALKKAAPKKPTAAPKGAKGSVSSKPKMTATKGTTARKSS